jgi:hypothetical protein
VAVQQHDALTFQLELDQDSRRARPQLEHVRVADHAWTGAIASSSVMMSSGTHIAGVQDQCRRRRTR